MNCLEFYNHCSDLLISSWYVETTEGNERRNIKNMLDEAYKVWKSLLNFSYLIEVQNNFSCPMNPHWTSTGE